MRFTIPDNIPPSNIPAAEPQKGGGSFWVALGLDVLGATAIGLGVYNNAKANDYYSEYKKILENVPPSQYAEKRSKFDSKYKKVQSTETMRNVFYATGGALLVGGVAVHICIFKL